MSVLSDTYKTSFKSFPREERAAILQHIKNQYWERGRLRYKCFPGGQTKLYDRIHEQTKRFPNSAEPVVALCHRRFGKSHLSALLCVERCLFQPGAEVHFGTDTKNHAREIIEGKLFETFKDMPGFISYRTRGNHYWFRNSHWPKGVESKLILEGLDYNMGGGMRGGSADLVAIDEAREIRHLEYVMKRVITPMFKGRPHPTMILCTTPPDSMDHDFTRIYVPRAEKAITTWNGVTTNSLVVIPASKNPDWTEDDTKLMLEDYGDKDDIGWRREIECELIADSTRMIVPEWPIMRHECMIKPRKRPAYYAPYVVLDMGWKDHSAAVFAYYDFHANKIVIVDELFVNYTPTEDFAVMLHDKTEANFPSIAQEHLRIMADGNALNLADLNRALSKISPHFVMEVTKYERDAAINNMRSGIQASKVLIEGKCEELDKQLLNGLWNKRRTDFDRSKGLGHCDLIACLNYLYREIRWGENVSPGGENVWREGICHIPTTDKPNTEDGATAQEALGKIFGNKRFLNRRRRY